MNFEIVTTKDNKIKTLLDKEVVYSNKWSSISRVIVKNRNKKKEIFTTNFGQRSAVLLLKEEKVLLTSQHRLLIDDYSWEIPGGKVNSGESFEEAAIRECHEETGYACRTILPLISFHPGLDTLYNPSQIFLCQDFYKEEKKDLHETEESKWFSLKKVKTLLEDGIFQDSLTIIGIQALLLKRIEKKI